MTISDVQHLDRLARLERRQRVLALRTAGKTYDQVALLTGLSRTGVFNICKRYFALGEVALHERPCGRRAGEGRRLLPTQESALRRMMLVATPDKMGMPELLWSRGAAVRLIERQTGLILPVRTLAAYLVRWDFVGGGLPSAPSRWMAESYPSLAVRAKLQGGKILWAHRRASAAGIHGLLTSATCRGQLQWLALEGVLGDLALIDFLHRLILGDRQKLFVVMAGFDLPADGLVVEWLAEHVDDIEVCHLPGPDPTVAPDDVPGSQPTLPSEAPAVVVALVKPPGRPGGNLGRAQPLLLAA